MVKKSKSKVVPPPPECPLNQCTHLLAGAWTADVIWYLREGKRCFTELHTDIKGISAKMLTNRVRRLQRDGVVERFSLPTSPPTVWYALTPLGEELCLALTNVVDIARRLRQTQTTSPQ